jgi:hypothetical protein
MKKIFLILSLVFVIAVLIGCEVPAEGVEGATIEIKYSYESMEEIVKDEYFKDTPMNSNNVYLVVDFDITNNGYNEFSTNPFNFMVVVDRIEYDNALVASLNNKLSSVNLLDGANTKGQLAFEVPRGFQDVEIKYSGFSKYNVNFINLN